MAALQNNFELLKLVQADLSSALSVFHEALAAPEAFDTLLALMTLPVGEGAEQKEAALTVCQAALRLHELEVRYKDLPAEKRAALREASLTHPSIASLVLRLEVHAFNDQSLLTALVDDASAAGAEPERVLRFLACLVQFCDRESADQVTLVDGNRILTLLVRLCLPSADAQTVWAAGMAFEALMPFISHNMAVEAESKAIMEAIAALCLHPLPRVRAAGLAALTAVAESYYGLLGGYMSGIFSIHSKILQEPSGGADALAVLDFWITVEDVEAEAEESRRLVQTASEHLLPLVLPFLGHYSPEEEQARAEDDAVNARLLAGLLLERLFQSSPPLQAKAFRFVPVHLAHADWRKRAIACHLFGALCNAADQEPLDGPSSLLLGGGAGGASSLCSLISDPSPLVATAASWAVYRGAKFCSGETRIALLKELLKTLQASQALPFQVQEWLVFTVAAICSHFAEDSVSSTSPLAPHAQSIAEIGMVLLHQLPKARPAVTEMLLALICAAPLDTAPILRRMLSMYAQAVSLVTKSASPATVDVWPLVPSLACICAIFKRKLPLLSTPEILRDSLALAVSIPPFYRACSPAQQEQLVAAVEDCSLLVSIIYPPLHSDAALQRVSSAFLPLLQASQTDLRIVTALHAALSSVVSVCSVPQARSISDQLVHQILARCQASSAAAAASPNSSSSIELVTPALELCCDLFLLLGGDVSAYSTTAFPIFFQVLDACTRQVGSLDSDDSAVNACIYTLCQLFSITTVVLKQPAISAAILEHLVPTAKALLSLALFDDVTIESYTPSAGSILQTVADIALEKHATTFDSVFTKLFKHERLFIDHTMTGFSRVVKLFSTNPELETEE
ncbi:MAG: hypothetical protein Q8P67_15415 [archaeon]|nr:hypothetical protein [archaeon]